MTDEEVAKFLFSRKRDEKGRFAEESKPADPVAKEIMDRYAKELERVHAELPMVGPKGKGKKAKKLTKDEEQDRMAKRKRAESALALAMYKELAAAGKPVSSPPKPKFALGDPNDPYLVAAKKGPMDDKQVAKFLEGTKRRLDHMSITPDQARHAGVFGQIGAGGGAIAGALVGAGVGAAAKRPAVGAGIGGAVGSALGGSAGAAAGVYAGRPKKKKKLTGSAPVVLSKNMTNGDVQREVAYNRAKSRQSNQRTAGAAVGAGTGLGVGALIGHGAAGASQRLKTKAAEPRIQNMRPGARTVNDATAEAEHLANYKRNMSNARMLGRTADFHASTKGRVGMAVGGALVGTAIVRHHQNKIAGQVEAPTPIAKMEEETKTKLARAGLVGAQLADIAAIKSAYHETTTAKKTGTGFKAALSYGSKKAALPIVGAGLVAAVGAERVMHSQQKKLQAANTANLKPKKPTNGVVAKSQQMDGSYTSVSAMSRQDRNRLKTHLKGGKGKRFSFEGEGITGSRDVKAVYRQHGLVDGLPRAMKETTRESTHHKNIHFGDSVGPELEGQINHSLDRKMVAGLKRPIVFHHGEINPAASAAAAGSHVTTGHKGRVIINSHVIDTDGKIKAGGQKFTWDNAVEGTRFHHLVNHELAHAAKVGKNPQATAHRDLKTQHKKAMGEEARADGTAVRGRGLYQRNGTVGTDRQIHGAWHDTDDVGRTKASRFHYNAVHDKVQDAKGTREAGQARSADAPFRRTLHGLPPKATPQPETHIPMGVGRSLRKPVVLGAAAGLGLAAGSKALYDHYHRDHSGKFAPGSNPSLRTH